MADQTHGQNEKPALTPSRPAWNNDHGLGRALWQRHVAHGSLSAGSTASLVLRCRRHADLLHFPLREKSLRGPRPAGLGLDAPFAPWLAHFAIARSRHPFADDQPHGFPKLISGMVAADRYASVAATSRFAETTQRADAQVSLRSGFGPMPKTTVNRSSAGRQTPTRAEPESMTSAQRATVNSSVDSSTPAKPVLHLSDAAARGYPDGVVKRTRVARSVAAREDMKGISKAESPLDDRREPRGPDQPPVTALDETPPVVRAKRTGRGVISKKRSRRRSVANADGLGEALDGPLGPDAAHLDRTAPMVQPARQVPLTAARTVGKPDPDTGAPDQSITQEIAAQPLISRGRVRVNSGGPKGPTGFTDAIARAVGRTSSSETLLNRQSWLPLSGQIDLAHKRGPRRGVEAVLIQRRATQDINTSTQEPGMFAYPKRLPPSSRGLDLGTISLTSDAPSILALSAPKRMTAVRAQAMTGASEWVPTETRDNAESRSAETPVHRQFAGTDPLRVMVKPMDGRPLVGRHSLPGVFPLQTMAVVSSLGIKRPDRFTASGFTGPLDQNARRLDQSQGSVVSGRHPALIGRALARSNVSFGPDRTYPALTPSVGGLIAGHELQHSTKALQVRRNLAKHADIAVTNKNSSPRYLLRGSSSTSVTGTLEHGSLISLLLRRSAEASAHAGPGHLSSLPITGESRQQAYSGPPVAQAESAPAAAVLSGGPPDAYALPEGAVRRLSDVTIEVAAAWPRDRVAAPAERGVCMPTRASGTSSNHPGETVTTRIARFALGSVTRRSAWPRVDRTYWRSRLPLSGARMPWVVTRRAGEAPGATSWNSASPAVLNGVAPHDSTIDGAPAPMQQPHLPLAMIRQTAPNVASTVVPIVRQAPHIQRQVIESAPTPDLGAAASSVVAPLGEVTAGPVAAAMSSGSPAGDKTELDELVEKACRQLMRRLSIEQERRGWVPWL